MATLRRPVAYIKAVNSSSNAQSSSEQLTQGLTIYLYICFFARVILTYNLRTLFGLCNGSTGIVMDIGYDTSTGVPIVNTKCLPAYVWVDFGSNYKGPSFFDPELNCNRLVPIFPRR